MDLHLIPGAAADADERAAVDALLGPPNSPWEGGSRAVGVEGNVARGGREARARRHLLLPALHAVNDRVGWISPGALNYICERLTVPPAEAWGVATFYAMFSVSRRPRRVIAVCEDIACRVAGAGEICANLRQRYGEPGAEGGEATWVRSPCLGQCDRAPAVLVREAGEVPLETVFAPADAVDFDSGRSPGDSGKEAIGCGAPQTAGPRDPALRLLHRVGVADPCSIRSYTSHGGYTALRRAVDLGPEGVVSELVHSRLLGRGGAAFPAGRKWQAVAGAADRPHYLVCNADESEPGTFKDRILMEEDPFALIEAMTIAGFATGCEKGYIYIRGEYPLATRRLSAAAAQAREAALLGPDVLGRGFRFEIEIRRGAGAYICGEETALFNSIEGYRGEPRNKPPFPTEAGLFGKPTLVNNVETLANVPWILLDGGHSYAASGTEGSTGTKLFCVSGRVARPGVYEVPFGATLKDLIRLAGGTREGRRIQAVLLGGAAGAFVTPDRLDIPLTFEGTRANGAVLGSGVVLIFDDEVDMTDIVMRIAAFFREESCGQCVPCRVGTVRQEEALQRVRSSGRAPGAADLDLLNDLAAVMRDASICGLGQTAPNAVLSAISSLKVFAGGRS